MNCEIVKQQMHELAKVKAEKKAQHDKAIDAVIKLNDEIARLRKLKELFKDDDFAIEIAKKCYDKHHDDRWCSTCESRRDGIDAYRQAIVGVIKDGE